MTPRGATFDEPGEDLDRIAADVVHAARSVRRALGTGLLERVYRIVLADELRRRGRFVEEEVRLPVHHRGRTFPEAYRVDLIVDRKVIVEVKATTQDHAAFEAQLLTYLRLSGLRLGLLVNIHAVPFGSGIRRRVNTPPS